MSWDLFVQDLPAQAKSVADIPDDFRPGSIGKRSEIIASIVSLIPKASFENPSWGLIDGSGWSVEINLGAEEECQGFAFHVRGGDIALGAVAMILQRLNLRAIDSQSGEFFVADGSAIESFRQWKTYRDQVLRDDLD